jgi:hypothetical protein
MHWPKKILETFFLTEHKRSGCTQSFREKPIFQDLPGRLPAMFDMFGALATYVSQCEGTGIQPRRSHATVRYGSACELGFCG